MVFCTSHSYSSCVLVRDKNSGKFALGVIDSDGYVCFLDKNENVLWNSHAISWSYSWPIKIRMEKDSPLRNLTQAELNRILFRADWLDGNTEYFAHAAEYPMYKIGQNGLASGGNNGAAQQQQQNGGTTTVVVEHHRDPVPVQQWQACWACGGMGTMGCDNCGGSGTKYIGDRLRICSRCNGQRVIPCNVCYGNRGQYITVYQ